MKRAREFVRCAIVVAALFGTARLLFLASAEAASLAGQEVRAGGTLNLQFPVNKYFQDYAAQGGNPRPTTGRALLMFPKGFDPARSWPILIVTSTSDNSRTSPMDAPRYQDAAMKEGWIDSAEVQRALHWFREIGKF